MRVRSPKRWPRARRRPAPDQPAVRRSELKDIGEPQAWPARADDALVRAAVVTNTPVLSLTPVLGDAGEEVAPGGMGALLRWR